MSATVPVLDCSENSHTWNPACVGSNEYSADDAKDYAMDEAYGAWVCTVFGGYGAWVCTVFVGYDAWVCTVFVGYDARARAVTYGALHTIIYR
jgi:hypothetical protein